MKRDELEQEVHRVHDRYLVEVVEELGICPFARRSRELGRVRRILVHVEDSLPSPADIAHMLAAGVRASEAAASPLEIALLTFIGPSLALRDPERFEAHLEPLRAAYRALAGTGSPPLCAEFFMVAFHPEIRVDETRPLTKDSLVPLLRRSPDPVVQCVRVDVLERVRRQAQATAHARRLAQLRADEDPVLRMLLENSIQTDCELSADIAAHNYESCGSGDGRGELDRRLEDIMADRMRSYGAWLAAPRDCESTRTRVRARFRT